MCVPSNNARSLAQPWLIMPDGREICIESNAGKREYRNRTLAMRERQGELCRWCGHWMKENETTFDHDDRRGGGRQDDRILVPSGGRLTRKNAAVHKLCNGERGSSPHLTKRDYLLAMVRGSEVNHTLLLHE